MAISPSLAGGKADFLGLVGSLTSTSVGQAIVLTLGANRPHEG